VRYTQEDIESAREDPNGAEAEEYVDLGDEEEEDNAEDEDWDIDAHEGEGLARRVSARGARSSRRNRARASTLRAYGSAPGDDDDDDDDDDDGYRHARDPQAYTSSGRRSRSRANGGSVASGRSSRLRGGRRLGGEGGSPGKSRVSGRKRLKRKRGVDAEAGEEDSPEENEWQSDAEADAAEDRMEKMTEGAKFFDGKWEDDEEEKRGGKGKGNIDDANTHPQYAHVAAKDDFDTGYFIASSKLAEVPCATREGGSEGARGGGGEGGGG
jgi:hypothetical protein